MKKLQMLYGLLMGMSIVAAIAGTGAWLLWLDLGKAAMAGIPNVPIHVMTPCEVGALRVARFLFTAHRVAILFAFMGAIGAVAVSFKIKEE